VPHDVHRIVQKSRDLDDARVTQAKYEQMASMPSRSTDVKDSSLLMQIGPTSRQRLLGIP
jgi:hypothetical protein